MTPPGETGGPTEDGAGVAVVGLGLIGGSLARDLAAAGIAVTGVDTDARTLDDAAREGVIRHAAAPGDPLPEGIGLVVLAVPVPAIVRLLGDAGDAGGGAAYPWGDPTRPIVTDVGSTKRSIMATAERAGLADRFVGGHPVAGDHRRGWGGSRRGLFRGATVWVCPGAASTSAVARVEALWGSVGAVPSPIDPMRHDRLLARASHLPQAVASALAGTLAGAGLDPGALGPGGRDTTRLAGSDPDLWTGILMDNADELLAGLNELDARLRALGAALRAGDAPGVRAWLAAAADWRGG